jgi:hypothetical protein
MLGPKPGTCDRIVVGSGVKGGGACAAEVDGDPR